jgi:hypothetical protein
LTGPLDRAETGPGGTTRLATEDELVAGIAPTIQRYLGGDIGAAATVRAVTGA